MTLWQFIQFVTIILKPNPRIDFAKIDFHLKPMHVYKRTKGSQPELTFMDFKRAVFIYAIEHQKLESVKLKAKVNLLEARL